MRWTCSRSARRRGTSAEGRLRVTHLATKYKGGSALDYLAVQVPFMLRACGTS